MKKARNANKMKARASLLLALLLLVPVLPLRNARAEENPSPSVESTFFDAPSSMHPGLFSGHEVMVIVPHQDDCLNLCSGVMESYLEAGSRVRIVYVTNGDFGGKSWGIRRIGESLASMEIIGIPPEDVFYLGYGDQWRGSRHIYNASPDKVIPSQAKQRMTYGSEQHSAYREGTPYTRNNLKQNLRSVIEEFLPDTIFCIDFDGHRDHRAVCLFFEEVMGEILKSRQDYRPTVFKGFGYGTSWYAAKDFYSENPKSTLNPGITDYLLDDPCFVWQNRVRFPVSGHATGRFLRETTTFRMLEKHVSQKATKHATNVINGDKVYWLRDTSSLLYGAALSASSGNALLLNDFKLIDSDNVNEPESVITGNVWHPAKKDQEKTVSVQFASPVNISVLRLYDSPDLTSNILDALVTFDDGTSVSSGPLYTNGSPTELVFPVKTVSSFSVRLTETEGNGAGLCELEAYEKEPVRTIRWIKFLNESDDFLYDYWLQPSGRESLSLYAFPGALPGDLSSEYVLEPIADEMCSAVFSGDHIDVSCPPGHRFELTVRSLNDPSVYDTILISNPSAARRLLLSILQKKEKGSV